jgi:hypothetical protein
MAKVVYNACYGGFGLSDKAMDRMVELGFSLQVNSSYDPNQPSSMFSNRKYECLGYVECPRHHSILVQVVEELGKEASGDCADLQIAEVDGMYRIEEYDGFETVETPDTTDWICANSL